MKDMRHLMEMDPEALCEAAQALPHEVHAFLYMLRESYFEAVKTAQESGEGTEYASKTHLLIALAIAYMQGRDAGLEQAKAGAP